MIFFSWLRKQAAQAVLQGIEDAAQHIAGTHGETGTPALVLRLPAPSPEPETPAETTPKRRVKESA